MASGGKWYGVATKHGYLVCNDWNEVDAFLHSRGGAERHKKFVSEEEALSFASGEYKILAEGGSEASSSRTASMVTPAPVMAGQHSRGESLNVGGGPQSAPNTTCVDADSVSPNRADHRLRSALLGQPTPGEEDDTPPW